MAPVNDNFADAVVLTGTSIAGTNVDATIEAGEDDFAGSIYASVWYKWTPSAEYGDRASFSFTSDGGSQEAQIYHGSTLGSLTNLNNIYRNYYTGIVAGEDHYIRVFTTGDPGNTGTFTLTYDDPDVPPPLAPSNDLQTNAEVLTGTTVSGDNTYAIAVSDGDYYDPYIPAFGDLRGTEFNVWYTWTPSAGYVGDATFDTIGSSFDTVLSVWDGTPRIEGTTLVAWDDDSGPGSTSSLTFTPTPLQTYYIMLGGYGDEDFGTFTLNYPDPAGGPSTVTADVSLTSTAAITSAATVTYASNDNFASARVLSGTSTTGNNSTATGEVGEPDRTYHSVWFTWTAPASVSSQIDTEGSDFDTYLYIYTGTTLTGLTLVASDDDSGIGVTSKIIFTPTSGVTYYIKIAGYNGGSVGNYVLRYPDPNIVLITGGATLTVTADVDAKLNYTPVISGGANLSANASLSSTLDKPTPQQNAYEYITVNTGAVITESKDSFESITVNTGAVITESKDSFEYTTANTFYVRNPDWKIFVPTLNSTNSDFWQPNGSAYLTSGGALLTPNSNWQVGNVVTKNIYSMKSFEFKIRLPADSASGGADGISFGIYYADQENANSIGGNGSGMAWSDLGVIGYGGNNPAGVAMLCWKWQGKTVLSSRLTHGEVPTDLQQGSFTLAPSDLLTLTADYVVGTASTYMFRLIRNGYEAFYKASIELPSKRVPIRFFIGGATGGASSVWSVENVSIYGPQGKKGFGVSRY